MSTVVTSAEVSVPVDAELKTFGSWLKRFISAAAIEALETAHSNATVGLFRHAMAVLDELGFTDAVHAVIDKTKIFVDLRDSDGDLTAMAEAVLHAEALMQPFAELRVVAGRRTDRAHWLAVARLVPGPPGDPPRLHVDFAARAHALGARSGDDAAQFRQRVLAWANDAPQLAGLVAEVDAIGARFAVEFRQRLPVAETTGTAATFDLIDLGETDVGRLRHLAFGEFVRKPTYRADPSYTRAAPHDGPFDYYRFDPYEPLARWFLIDAMIAGSLRTAVVRLIAADGIEVGRGDAVGSASFSALPLPRGAVRISGGELVIADTIPEVRGLDIAETLSEYAPGYGGSGDG